MKYALPLLFLAGPAFAHHEAIVATALPSMLPWLMVLAGGAAALGWQTHHFVGAAALEADLQARQLI